MSWVTSSSNDADIVVSTKQDSEVIITTPDKQNAHWFKNASIKNKIRVISTMIAVVAIMFSGATYKVKTIITELQLKKYKNYKIQAIEDNGILYGFYTYTIDTNIGNNSMTYEFSPKDIFPVDASYLITEVDTNTIDSVFHFYKKYEAVNEYIINCKEFGLVHPDSIKAKAIASWRGEPTLVSYEDEVDHNIIKEVRVKKAKKAKKHKSAPIVAGVSNSKRIAINDIIAKDAKDRDKLINFLAEDRNLYNYVYYANKYGYSPGVIIVFGALESGYGESSLTKDTKNKGNIKCFKPHNHEAHGCVRAYDKIEQGWDYYESFASSWEGIRKKLDLIKGYKALRKLPHKPTADQLIDAIHRSPYATDKHQDRKLKDLYKRFDMEALDNYIKLGYNITSASGTYTFLDQAELP